MDFMAPMIAKLSGWWNDTSPAEMMWLAIGVTGQLMFSARWLLQWSASERAKSSVVPATFWYSSLLGGLMVLSYGIYKFDPVVILGQFGVIVYARNVYFLLMGAKADTPPDIEEPVTEAHATPRR